ncbi:hypothetical protein GPK34_00845 [Secundilactobacillus kimchicus]|uniref:hypothetical protein n=1 Tax=Secundilactobacillus kimchicus TaxID=528209 RepID=UPI001C01BE2D|nr:hypothetical protein [Secundilactobacillus kimchicus]MBT9670586.1 hypothetical protein [Secundilactobacillus kimchicus]
MEFEIDETQLQQTLDEMFDSIKLETKYAKDFAAWIQQSNGKLSAKSSGNSVEVTLRGMQAQAHRQQVGFLDLKQFFAQSSKAKQKKNGGWYLIVPIQQKAKNLRAVAPRSIWNQISHMNFGSTGQLSAKDGTNLLAQGLQSDQSNVISPLTYSWKSTNITRVAPQSGKGTHGHYIAFRTVSDKSDPSSWIMGRQAFTNDNTTANQQADISNMLSKLYQSFATQN